MLYTKELQNTSKTGKVFKPSLQGIICECMSEQLVNYILQQINAGYKVDDVENYLKNYGYDKSDVASSIKTAVDITARGYINFVDQQINSGLKLPQIRSNLVGQGYDYRIVDHAMNHYHSNFLSSIKQKIDSFVEEDNKKKQLSTQINSSIKDGLNYGLTLENIQSNLIGQGFDVNLITKEINKFRETQLHIPKNAMVITIFALLFVGLGFGVFNLISGPPSPAMQGRLLDVRVENAQPDLPVHPGSNLFFHVEKVPMGYEREFDVDFTYTITDRAGNIIRTASATKSIVSNLADRILIPSSTPPGVYRLEVVAEYMGEAHARTSFEFDVVERSDSDPPIEDEIEDIVEENITPPVSPPSSPPTDTPVTEPPVVPPVDESLDDESLDVETPVDQSETDLELFSSSRSIRISDQNRLRSLIDDDDVDYALFLCERIRDSATSTRCTVFVALEISDIEICDTLEGIHRDSCLNEFGKRSVDDSICEQIVNRNFNSLCRISVIRNKNLGLQNIEDEREFQQRIKELYG